MTTHSSPPNPLRRPWRAALALALLACSTAFAGPVLIVRSDRDTVDAPTAQALARLGDLQAAAGNTVTVVRALPADLSGYSQVWDLAFRDAVSAASQSAYLGYLQQGGRLMMLGDNDALFGAHNDGIRALIAAAGGGDVGAQTASVTPPQTVRAPFNAPQPVPALLLTAPAYFDNAGTGDWILATADDDFGSGLAFDVGRLANARAGRLFSILDIDLFGDLDPFNGGSGHALVANLVDAMDHVSMAQVPEPPTAALLGLALVAALGASRRGLRRAG